MLRRVWLGLWAQLAFTHVPGMGRERGTLAHTQPASAVRDRLGPEAGQRPPPPPPGLLLPVLGFLLRGGAGASGAKRAEGAGAAGGSRGPAAGAPWPGPGFRNSGPGSGSRSGAAAALGTCANAARPPLARQPPGRQLCSGSPPALPSPLPSRPNRARPFLPPRGARRLQTSPVGSLPAPRALTCSRSWLERPHPSAPAPGAPVLPEGGREPPPPPRRQPRWRPRTPRERRHCGCGADWAPGRFFLPFCWGGTVPLPFVSGSGCPALSAVRLRPG